MWIYFIVFRFTYSAQPIVLLSDPINADDDLEAKKRFSSITENPIKYVTDLFSMVSDISKDVVDLKEVSLFKGDYDEAEKRGVTTKSHYLIHTYLKKQEFTA